MGDAYLKYPELSWLVEDRQFSPFTPPYVKSIPDVFYLPIKPSYRFLILASDGLWDFISPEQAVEFVANHSHDDPSDVSAKLVDRALMVAALDSNLSLEQLKALPIGARRRRHDDTTVVVLYF